MKGINVIDEKTQEALATVLEYVERWNKKDEDKETALAHHYLEGILYEQNCEGHNCTSECRRSGCNCPCGEYCAVNRLKETSL